MITLQEIKQNESIKALVRAGICANTFFAEKKYIFFLIVKPLEKPLSIW